MRIVIMGTGGFAVPTFERLLGSRHDIVAVVTMPIRHARGAKNVTTPVRSVASASGIEIFDPENINDPVLLPMLNSWQADLLFVCDYGKILAPHVLAAAKHGGINLHGSLLPKYRGAAPINRALLNGEPMVGVSVIHMTPQLDAGPVVAMSDPMPVLPCDTAVEVEDKLAQIGADLVLEVIPQFESGTLTPVLQRDELASKAPKLKKHEGEIDWRRSACEIFWQYQALQPWPKIFTNWHRKNATENNAGDEPPMRLIIGRISPIEGEIADEILIKNVDISSNEIPGTVMKADDHGMIVTTGDGLLQVHEIQPSGRKMMQVNAFLRGYPLRPGDRFGAETA